MWIVQAVAVVAIACLLQFLLLLLVMAHANWFVHGGRYYRASRTARRAFKRWLRFSAVLLSPVLAALRKLPRPPFGEQGFHHRGVAAPRGACSPASFERAEAYRPRANDLFVVTQMRSGTTWMQHLAYQVLTRGRGDLPAESTTLGAVSPWLEADITVDVDSAPAVGKERPKRLVKTHLPRQLCPYAPDAKYVYVVRHPVTCFASCVDFVRNNQRSLAPSLDELEAWFTSPEQMWWGTWSEHVAGWYDLAATADNVLCVRFEDMLADLSGVAGQLVDFLELAPLDDAELRSVVEKCQFDSMRKHAEAFEMYPPHLLQQTAPFFIRGRRTADATLPDEVGERIRAHCLDEAIQRNFPIESLYDDFNSTPPRPATEHQALSFECLLPVAVHGTPQTLDS